MLPRSSRIVVIDDKPDEAAPILNILAKEGCSAAYFSGDPESLPDAPLQDVRVVFLDLDITGGLSAVSQIISSNVVNHLSRVLAKASKYILIVWTGHPDVIPYLERDLINAELAPIFRIDNLEKAECQRNPRLIQEAIDQAIDRSRPMLGHFLEWENVIFEAASNVVNDFASLAKTDEDISNILYKLAQSHSGNSDMGSDVNRMGKNAFSVLGDVMLAKLNEKISALDLSKLNPPTQGSSSGLELIINRIINLSTCERRHPRPGDVFARGLTEKGLKILLKKEKILSKQTVEYIEKAIQDGLLPIFVEVSPICDHAQNKIRFHRVLFGFLCPKTVDFKKPCDFLYQSPFYFEYKGKPYKIVLNKQEFMATRDRSFFGTGTWLFTIGNNWLFDIQHKVAGHVSRPGITSLEYR